ncbi:hypothetical protein [Nannocystis bainbridge]|uniref:Uncharacterized protein n=1 Tax=Nannocystis bainbridge TaxID=2995303 RepID=A0ABT5DYT2_9BACT|nr:hypothetical protein [Nannocystis bainbridge]MDC0717602.1 hypothetical protein [Nannocystis bainbridge]
MSFWTGPPEAGKIVRVTAGGRGRRCAAALLLLRVLAACEVAAPSDDILPLDEAGPELSPCVSSEAAFLRAALEPMPRDDGAELRCTVTAMRGDAGSRVLDLACDGEAMRLYVEADPAPAGDGFAAGQELRVRAIVAPGEVASDPDVWLRVEDAGGALLLAAAVGARVDPPEGGGWAAPFAWREAASACMVEETACGELRRGALDLQLSGGAPLRLYDGTSSAAGDEGAFVAYVEAARTNVSGSGCPRQRLVFGLIAAR